MQLQAAIGQVSFSAAVGLRPEPEREAVQPVQLPFPTFSNLLVGEGGGGGEMVNDKR